MAVVIYKLTDTRNGESFEGTANFLGTKLNISPTTIQRGFRENRIISGFFKVEKTDKAVRNQRGVSDDRIFKEWDAMVEMVRKKYGSKRA